MIEIDDYLDQIAGLCTAMKGETATIRRLVDDIVTTAARGKKIITFGNGGSAATASHFIGDLSKISGDTGCRYNIRAISLTDNIPTLTAWANDDSYADIFARQLANLGEAGDMAVAISGSGNSENMLKGVATAKDMDITSFGLCGFDGGRLAKLADYAITVSAPTIQQAEDMHVVLLHAVSLLVRGIAAEQDWPA